ncbi:serine-protein kinase ATM isoform X3 [Pseudomyrmex gracilis]|uniref:serine-protein kinase ATM isoform X3 n=1 Tax=Pseudomyrmex gracilis TaxID=219809 RepID=UPI00099560B6|nr:serine-protein kinase ATM isoform X3 [Pseudomyrmex gracilis]
MSRLLERIGDTLKLADSSKITDKKRCVTELLELYRNEDAVKEICLSSGRDDSRHISWSYILLTVHKLVVDEAERRQLPNKETAAKNNERQSLSSLVISTVRRSNESLKAKEIVSLILQILDSKIYVHYQDTYLRILIKYVLPKSSNHSDITVDQWRELLKVCTKLYKKAHIEKHIVLDALQMIVKYSFFHVNFLFHIKNLLLFLENIFSEDLKRGSDEQLAESFCRLASSVSRQIMTESHFALCAFSENIAKDILLLNSSEEKYKLLLIFLEIHHFESSDEIRCSTLASTGSSKWKDILRSMWSFVQENCKLDIRWYSFIQFASEVVKQIQDNTMNVACSLDVSSSLGSSSQPKRRRTIGRIENIVDFVTESSPEEVWPVLRILTETLRKYPQCLKSENLAPLLQRLTEVAQPRDESVMDHLFCLAAILMENKMFNEEDTQDATVYWNKIWDLLLRSLEANQNEESGHVLMRCFVKRNKMPNANGILKLYLTKTIGWTRNSVLTLRQLCECVSPQEYSSALTLDSSSPASTSATVSTPVCDRTRLLDWLLNMPSHKLASRLRVETIEDVCILTVNLVLNSRNRQNVRAERNYNREQAARISFVQRDIHSTDLPRLCRASLMFDVELSVCLTDKCSERDSEMKFNNGFPVSCSEDAIIYLKNWLCNIFQEEDTNNDDKNTGEIYVILIKIALLARLLCALKQLSILTLEDTVGCMLIAQLEKRLKNSFEILARIDWSRCKYAYLLSVTGALNVLYGTTYDADVAEIIVSASTEKMLKNIFDLLNIDDNRNYGSYNNAFQERRRRSSVYSAESSEFATTGFPRERAICLRVVEALASFCALHIGVNKSALQKKTMRILQTVHRNFASYVESEILLTILDSFVSRDRNEIPREYKNEPIDFFLSVCEKDCGSELLRGLFNLLPYFFEYAIKCDYSPKTIVKTLARLYERIHRRNCGVLVHVDYMKCACGVVRIDPSFSWNSVGDSDDDVTTLLNSVLDYIGNELFVLRSQAVRCLQLLLSFENVVHKWKEWIFVKVEKIVFKLVDETANRQSTSDLSDNKNLRDSQRRDEKETTTATALLTLASVTCASHVLQGSALCAILRLTVKHVENLQVVRKVLSVAARYTTTNVSLIEDNLSYLLTYWLKDVRYPLQKFPWILTGKLALTSELSLAIVTKYLFLSTGCETPDKFFRKYVNCIVPILLRTSDLAETTVFCIDRAGLPFEQVFEDVFPSCFVWLVADATVDATQWSDGNVNVLRKLMQNTGEFAKMVNFSELFNLRFQDVLVELVQRLHDEDDFKRVLSIKNVCFPATDPPHFSRVKVDRCFIWLEENFLEKSMTRVLVKRQPAILQKTLLRLASAVHTSRSWHDRLKRLHQYAYFYTRVSCDLAESIFDDMAAFLVRDVCYSLLYLARSENNAFAEVCCKFLYLFLQRALPARAGEVRDILRFIVANLIGLTQASSGDVQVAAACLLKFLIVEQKDVLREAIAKLGSFPNHEVFRDAREAYNAVKSKPNGVCLEDELEHFLDAMSEENAECTLEDLASLTRQLSTRKRDLRELRRKSPKDCANNILYRLIFKLVKLTESSNPRVSTEATKCLGELGPTDSNVALRPSGSLVRESNHAIEALTYRSVAMLMSFVAENSVQLRKVSADALYAVLSTSCGQKLFDREYLKNLSNVLEECSPLKIDYIRPFACSGSVAKQTLFSVDFAQFRVVINPVNTFWIVKDGETYADWIVNVTCSIAECFQDSYLKSFLPVCRLSIEFCELILPRIFYLVIYQSKNFNAMCDCVNRFFRHCFAISQEEEAAQNDSYDLKIVRRMLDVVNHVRAQLEDGTMLKLDYVYLAKAAHKCSAYYSALLFAQLACESISTDYPDFSRDSRIDFIYEHEPEIGRVLQRIMLDTYLNINDPDATCDAGSSHLLDYESRMQYYARTNRWDKVMLAKDIELSSHSNGYPLSTSGNARMEMSNALRNSGLQFLQWQFQGNCLGEKFSYECAWRLGNWNLPDDHAVSSHRNDRKPQQSRLELLEDAFHAHHYQALKYFHENDRHGMEQAIERARKIVISELRLISLESNRTVNEKLSQLRLLLEIEQLNWVADSPDEKCPVILRRWQEHEIGLTGQYNCVEPILWQRIVMFRARESLRANIHVRDAFFATCLDLAALAESQSDFPVATRALDSLRTYPNLSAELRNQFLYQESLLAWMNCDQIIARRQLRNLIEKNKPIPSLRAKALRVYGDWMAETKSENPQVVIQKYYLESIKISETTKQTADVVRNLYSTQASLARFADAQYEQISGYMKSPIYESLKEYARTNVQMDQAQMMKNQDLKRAVIISHKQSTNDAAELKYIEQERRSYLAQALKYYLKTLRNSEEHDMLVFRLIALWLDNMFDDEVNESLLDELDYVPSFKFVPLLPQLAAHVSSDAAAATDEQQSFAARIFRILERCALEHPYHTLPVLLALKNLHSDYEYDEESRVAKKEERRVLGAKKLFKQLNKSSVSTIVHEMEILSRALLSLAYWHPKTKCTPGKSYQIPRDQPITKMKNLNNVLLPTLSLPVRSSCNYNDVVGIRLYKDTCEFVGGVTAPKKIICVGTDGVQRRQLVKGKDDLRQDAVMQQVFTVMNTLLRTCKETKRRNLRIRTYKVVPLTQRSGVLEWCDNTVPITATLVGTPSAPGMHRKYYPRDLTAEMARDKIKNVAQESNEKKLKVFLDCCKRMRPAFHHFFEEKYRSPESWVERTLTYTRSVAVTSIAGYILGLGDRHLSNILIDEHTAEVVHIDFGVAFEQGKVLPIPETIPFRLTRDIEVAMGAYGIEGTMRRSCEVTMTMLRDQRQIIITLLQVLLYDPLFTWAITPEKAWKMQSDVMKDFTDSSGKTLVETNKIAKRALLRIEQKLQGTEDGLVSSVSGQVERLLQEARDPANLCRVYCGWQPYL